MKRFILVLLVLLLFLTSGGAFSSFEYVTREIEPFVLRYTVRGEGIVRRKVTIRSAFAEYFRLKNGGTLLYLVFYPYKIQPWQWRQPYENRKSDPDNFVVIKMVGRGPGKIDKGIYTDLYSGGTPMDPGSVYFTSTIITSESEYSFPRDSGKVIINEMDLTRGGIIAGKVKFKSKNLSVEGPFRAYFLVDR